MEHQRQGASVLVCSSRDLMALTNRFDDVRTNQPPSAERSVECDRIVQAATAFHEKGMVRNELILQLSSLLDGTQGDRMVALTYVTHNVSMPMIDPILEKILSLLQKDPLFIQHLARMSVSKLVVHGYLTQVQTRKVYEAAQVVLTMPEDGDSHKRQYWCAELLPLLTRRVEGPTKSQVLGCIIGQCAGDALGFPVEGQGKTVTRAYTAEFVRRGKPPAEARGGFPFGQFTDDSQLAREFLISIVHTRGQFDPQDYANRIAGMFVPPDYKIVGLGMTTERAALLLNQGVSWRRSGIVGANGNGSCMRAGPMGATFSRGEWETLRRVAIDQAIITHASSSSAGSAVAIAAAARIALEPGTLHVDSVLERISWMVRPVDGHVADKLDELKGWVSLPLDQALPLIVQAGVQCGDSTWGGGEVISSSCVQAMLWALYSFLNNQNDYVGCVATAIEGGGDTDTTAAMAGAICGAHVGLEGIPTAFSEKLHDRDAWTLEQLVQLGENVYDLVVNDLLQY